MQPGWLCRPPTMTVRNVDLLDMIQDTTNRVPVDACAARPCRP
jgi:hypothetical protein